MFVVSVELVWMGGTWSGEASMCLCRDHNIRHACLRVANDVWSMCRELGRVLIYSARVALIKKKFVSLFDKVLPTGVATCVE